MNNPIRQLFGQTAVYGMGIVLPRVLNYLLLTPFYTRIFEQSEYGIITELYAYVVFLLVILTYGMETGFFRFAGASERKERVYSSVLLSLLVTSVLFSGCVNLSSVTIGSWIGYGENPEYIRWLAWIVGIDAFTSVPFARIRLNNRALKYALIRIAEVTVNIGLNVFFLFLAPENSDSELVKAVYNPEIGVGYVLISNLAASVLKLLLLSGEIVAGLRGRADLVLLKKILNYSYPLLIAGMAGTVNEALDRILLKHMLGGGTHAMQQLGIYGANFKLAVLMTLFVQMFKYAAEPFFFARAEDSEAKKLYASVMNAYIASALIIFLMVNLFLDYFILFIGPGFREGSNIVPVVLMANLVMGIFFNLSIWYKLTNRTWIGAVLVASGAMITIAINVFFIPVAGYMASAWAHLICYSVMVLLSYFWSRRYFAVPYRLKKIAGYFLAAILIYTIHALWMKELEAGKDLVNVFFMGLFVSIVYLGERKSLAKTHRT